MSYVLLGAFINDTEPYAVRTLVDKSTSEIAEMGIFSLKAVKAEEIKKKSPNSVLKDSAAVTEQSSLRNAATEFVMPIPKLSASRTMTSSKN